MRSKMCEMFGIDVPIFAFSHCRDVVAEVSRAGGMGILGMARMNPARVEAELAWIDEHVDGRPYGIDVLMPSRLDDSGGSKFDVDTLLPTEHVDFVRRVGSFALESVVAFVRNGWQACSGISGSFGVEYAC